MGGGSSSPPGMRHTPASTSSSKNWGVRCTTSDLSIRPSGPKILIRFAIMAKSVPKKLVIWPKILVTQFFWHRLSRLSKFYFPARREVASSRPAGKSNLDSRKVFLCTRRRDSNITYSLTPNPLQPPASMDKLFDTPSGPISHREVRAAVAEEISLVNEVRQMCITSAGIPSQCYCVRDNDC